MDDDAGVAAVGLPDYHFQLFPGDGLRVSPGAVGHLYEVGPVLALPPDFGNHLGHRVGQHAVGVAYSKPGIRAYSNGHSTYINDPDGNMIELVQHPLGLRDSKGKNVEMTHDLKGMAWAHMPGFGRTT